MMRRLLIFGLILLVQLLSAQRDKRSVPFTIRGSVCIPGAVSSDQFRKSFNGVYSADLSVNARAFSTFFVGLGYQNLHFQNDKEVFAFVQSTITSPNGESLLYDTRLQCHGAFIKIGYDQFFEKGFVTYGLNAGIMFCEYQKVVADTSADNAPFPPPTFNAPFIQPGIEVNFLTDGPLSFSILFSYGTMLKKFDPKAPRFNQIGDIQEQTNNYVMSWINIGFGFGILLGK